MIRNPSVGLKSFYELRQMAVVANQVDYFNLISGSGLAVKDSNVSFDSVFS